MSLSIFLFQLFINSLYPPPPGTKNAALCGEKVEQLQTSDNPDEKEMDRHLKAHDDLQTVLRLYEGVLDGKKTLPLRRSRRIGDVGAAAGGAAREELRKLEGETFSLSLGRGEPVGAGVLMKKNAVVNDQ